MIFQIETYSENIRKENSPENRFSLTAKGDETQVSALLAQYPQITPVRIRTEDGLVHADLESEAGADVREELFYAFAKHSIPLIELRKVTPSLEEIFLALTSTYSDEDDYEDEDDDDFEEEDDDEDDEDEDEEDDDGYTPLFLSGNGGK